MESTHKKKWDSRTNRPRKNIKKITNARKETFSWSKSCTPVDNFIARGKISHFDYRVVSDNPRNNIQTIGPAQLDRELIVPAGRTILFNETNLNNNTVFFSRPIKNPWLFFWVIGNGAFNIVQDITFNQPVTIIDKKNNIQQLSPSVIRGIGGQVVLQVTGSISEISFTHQNLSYLYIGGTFSSPVAINLVWFTPSSTIASIGTIGTINYVVTSSDSISFYLISVALPTFNSQVTPSLNIPHITRPFQLAAGSHSISFSPSIINPVIGIYFSNASVNFENDFDILFLSESCTATMRSLQALGAYFAVLQITGVFSFLNFTTTGNSAIYLASNLS